jgi:hypothetical protein
MTSQLIREPAPNGLREAAEQIVPLLSKTESGNAFWWRKLDEARLALEAALAQPALEPEGYYALLQTGDSITIRNDTLAPMKVQVPSGASLMGDYRPAPEPASEPAKLLAYQHAHDEARALGFPSLTEALEKLHAYMIEPTPEPALTFRDRAAQGKAYLLNLSNGGQPEQFRTVAGLRRQEPEAPDLFVGVGVFSSQAELQIKAIALRGTLERVELSFEDGERVRGSALFREIHFLGDGNGEAAYRISLHLTEVEHV